MKQVIQSRRSGKLAVKDVPAPADAPPGHLLVETRASLISAGTERMVVDFARKSLAGKAKARPDLVKKVLEKARRDGLKATYQTVMARLDEPLPLGYSAAGRVVRVGEGLEGRFRVGDRVAVAGAGIANHADLNLVPENLAAPIPDGVSDEAAAYGTLGAIALHAVRNADPKLGETVAVIGLGLLGQLACRFAGLSGARVIGLDFDAGRRDLAADLGADLVLDPRDDGLVETITGLTQDLGCDSIIVAAATDKSDPLHLAADVARDRAKVVMVGLTGTEFSYAAFMKKELNLIVSRSYGPGRYDADYEGRGMKYPPGFVRWTETENLGEVLRLAALSSKGRPGLDVGPLTTHRFDIADAEQAYAMITEGTEPHLGVILTYEEREAVAPKPVSFPVPKAKAASGPTRVGLIGGGAFATAMILPELKKQSGVVLETVVTQRGASAEHASDTFGFAKAGADPVDILDDPAIDAVIIATRHDSHADLTAKALKAGKAVLVEKPLGLTQAELDQVAAAREADGAGFFQIGFNRRFAPMISRIKQAYGAESGAKTILMRVNAGAIPADHWVHDPEAGGGRILGEACHFIDLARDLTGSPIAAVQADAARTPTADDVALTLTFADGSLATVFYTALGDTGLAKERIEVFGGGQAHVIEDFRTYTSHIAGRRSENSAAQDKGIAASLSAFLAAVKGDAAPAIDEAELLETSRATVKVLESLRTGERVSL